MNVAARVGFEELGSNQGVQFNETGAFYNTKLYIKKFLNIKF